MSDKDKNKSVEDENITIKDSANKLDLSEATVKKYLKDFELPFGKGPANKALISNDTFQALTEIAKLRANGLSIQEIKELKTEEPSKHIADEIEEVPVLEQIKPKEETELVESLIAEELTEVLDIPSLEDLSASESSSETAADAEEDAAEGTQDESEGEEDESTQRRRRGFNYRYVERQISADSKRVSSIRIRLKNPNLSVQDRMFFDEALERRILFLNGWKHILKWIAK
jgi:DNA-binding transcriptional MerR regulator